MLDWLLRDDASPTKSPSALRTRLGLERLEGRDVPAVSTLDVNSLLDTPDVAGDNKWEDANGNKTLRAAIDYSNEVNNVRVGNYNANRYDIVFMGVAAEEIVASVDGMPPPPPTPRVITLTSTLEPKSNLNIQGHTSLTIRRDPFDVAQFRLFDFSAGTDSRLFNLVLAHGTSGLDGGAILNQDKLLVEACTFFDNRSNTQGGAIACAGATSLLQVFNSHFHSNSANLGGAISAELGAQVAITDSDIFANAAFTVGMELGQGGGVYVETDTPAVSSLTLTRTRIFGNSATGAGGGVHIFDSDFSMADGEIHGNSSGLAGGGFYVKSPDKTITLTNVKLTNNQAGGKGGGAYIAEGTLSATLRMFTGNSAAGGIHGIAFKKDVASVTLTVPPNQEGQPPQQGKEEDP